MSSVAFNKIIPFGQNFVFDDMPLTLTLKERVAFFLCLIDVSVDSRKYSESRLGCRLGRHIAGLLDGVEDAPLHTLEICEKSMCSMGFHLEQ